MVHKVYVTYNEVHKLCQESAQTILSTLRPNLIIAIGGGGYVPARILRSFLKRENGPNIPIQAIGLSLYETLPTTASSTAASNGTGSTTQSKTTTQKGEGNNDDRVVETPGTKVTRTQWLDLSSLGSMTSLVGKNILIVDEVDDTRTTLEYAVRELEKDVEMARQKMAEQAQDKNAPLPEPAKFSIFVLHNKDKPKHGHLPAAMLKENRYLAAKTTGDVWICYPWEATDIDEHDRYAFAQNERPYTPEWKWNGGAATA